MAIDLKEIINSCFNKNTKNVERYTHNGSTWLIFTEEKKWVIELTKEGTLWYNYYFFQNIMKLLSLDVVENQHYITEWVENTIINPVKHTDSVDGYGFDLMWVEDVIQNGVKDTKCQISTDSYPVENTIKNGVKYTEYGDWEDGDERLDDIIQNGVKETTPGGFLGRYDIRGEKIYKFEVAKQEHHVDDVINNGIKETKYCELHSLMMADHIIRDGIKETWGYEKQPQTRIDDVIMNGYKD